MAGWSSRTTRSGTPNRNWIALRTVRDMLDEASFSASPGHHVPNKIGTVAGAAIDKVTRRNRRDEPDE